ncbi:hypothetical protein TARUN_9108 [Trichoderma arundinaceum]|uniref:Uncharacterized protein n=1 Tax=Trichoderma arundinaceum TaxID=490622 RepID=A0A395NBP8_TRIAR|nr:hypothetical protein TARUN_9108 [Trichoderma arundinaceum]
MGFQVYNWLHGLVKGRDALTNAETPAWSAANSSAMEGRGWQDGAASSLALGDAAQPKSSSQGGGGPSWLLFCRCDSLRSLSPSIIICLWPNQAGQPKSPPDRKALLPRPSFRRPTLLADPYRKGSRF